MRCQENTYKYRNRGTIHYYLIKLMNPLNFNPSSVLRKLMYPGRNKVMNIIKVESGIYFLSGNR